jgi:ferrous iron transport protein A
VLTAEGRKFIMPLTMVKAGEISNIKKITGKDETKRFLANLGFVEGENITVVSEIAGNMIINIKDTRIALDRSMANRIIV